MSLPGSGTVVLTCGGAAAPASLAALPRVVCGGRPGRADVDDLLPDARRLVVVGQDADLAAVLLRLLRTEHLGVELALVAAAPTAATRVWGLPHGVAAAELAVWGTAEPSVLVRDAHGSVLVGLSTLRGVTGTPLRGEAYVDDTLVFSGEVRELRARPTPDGPGVEVSAVAVRRLRRLLRRPTGGSAQPRSWVHAGAVPGRAVQVGSTGCVVLRDGVPVERVTPRWSLYRHTADWLLVRPG